MIAAYLTGATLMLGVVLAGLALRAVVSLFAGVALREDEETPL